MICTVDMTHGTREGLLRGTRCGKENADKMLFFRLGCVNALTAPYGCPGANLQFRILELAGRRQEELLMKLCPERRTAGPVGLAQSHSACLVFELWYLCPAEPALL